MWFQAAINDSMSSLFDLGCFLEISKDILYQRFSIGLRSGDCAGQSNVFILLSLIQLVTLFAQWHGALSSWKKKSDSNSLSADGNIDCCSISMYLVALTMPSAIFSLPTPLAAMQPQIITFVGYFTERFKHSGLYFSCGNLLTNVVAWFPRMQKVLSSLNNTFSHSSLLHLEYFFAHRSRFFLCGSVRSGFLIALQPLNPNSKHLLLTVEVQTCTEHFSCHSRSSRGEVSFLLANDVLRSTRSCLWVVFFGRPVQCLSAVEPVSWSFLR